MDWWNRRKILVIPMPDARSHLSAERWAKRTAAYHTTSLRPLTFPHLLTFLAGLTTVHLNDSSPYLCLFQKE